MEYPEFKRLVQVIAKLRHPTEGCPWDLEQTHRSLVKYLIEESYEFAYSADKGNPKMMEEEIGDVLLQVLLHSQIASESGHFDIESVSKTLADKMVYRHPHVFKDKSLASSAEDVSKNWENIKTKERREETFFKEEDAYMPALMAAKKIGKKSQKVNFDWDHIGQVFDKVKEELREVQDELEAKQLNKAKLKEEIGDLLFSVAQLARHADIEAEEALKEANLKFIGRFTHMEKKAKAENLDMMSMDVNQLEELWQTVKKEMKS